MRRFKVLTHLFPNLGPFLDDGSPTFDLAKRERRRKTGVMRIRVTLQLLSMLLAMTLPPAKSHAAA
ncbi:MAG TPA: hypothetical protein VF499_06170, partial [Afipia sp.]